MALVEPIIVVLGVRCGGTSAVAGVLHHLGVFMGTEFSLASRELTDSWEELGLHQLCSRAFSEPGDQLQMDPVVLRAKLRSWAEDHRRAARAAGGQPGAKDPCLCLAVDFIRDAWGPIVPVVVDRPIANVVASLNRLGWLPDERERAESTARLIAARDNALAGTAKVTIDFEELRAAPAVVIRRLADELGLDVTQSQIEAATNSIVKPVEMGRDTDPYRRFIDQFLPEVHRNPGDSRSISLLAQAYFDSGDFASARKWFARKIEIGERPEEEIFLAMFRVAQSMEQLGEPWPAVQDAYLRAWEYRPTRAEPLFAIALRYRGEKRYQLGYLFAGRAAEIPLPDDDMLVPYPDIYTWRAVDEKAVCAYRIGKPAEAFTLWRHVLASPGLPHDDRQRIALNRDLGVPAMIDAASSYPDARVQRLASGTGDPKVVVSLIAGSDRSATEHTLDSFLNCCTDAARVGRFLLLDTGLPTHDREALQQRYGFLEFALCQPGIEAAQVRAHIHQRFWLHLGEGWRFFAPDDYVTRLTAVLDAEPSVCQVAINLDDAATLTGTSAAEQTVRRTPDGGRYLITDGMASGPAMFDTARLDRAVTDAPGTACLDEVLCIRAV